MAAHKMFPASVEEEDVGEEVLFADSGKGPKEGKQMTQERQAQSTFQVDLNRMFARNKSRQSTLAGELGALDKDGTGIVDEADLIEFLRAKAKSTQTLRHTRYAVLGLVILCTLLIGVNAVMTWLITDMAKDTAVNNDSGTLEVRKGTQEARAVAVDIVSDKSWNYAANAPISSHMPDAFFNEMKSFTVGNNVSTDATEYMYSSSIPVSSWLRLKGFGSSRNMAVVNFQQGGFAAIDDDEILLFKPDFPLVDFSNAMNQFKKNQSETNRQTLLDVLEDVDMSALPASWATSEKQVALEEDPNLRVFSHPCNFPKPAGSKRHLLQVSDEDICEEEMDAEAGVTSRRSLLHHPQHHSYVDPSTIVEAHRVEDPARRLLQASGEPLGVVQRVSRDSGGYRAYLTMASGYASAYQGLNTANYPCSNNKCCIILAGFDGLDATAKTAGGIIANMDGMWEFSDSAKTGTHGVQGGGSTVMVNMNYKSATPFTGLPRAGLSVCGYSGLPACDGSGPRFYSCDAYSPEPPPPLGIVQTFSRDSGGYRAYLKMASGSESAYQGLDTATEPCESTNGRKCCIILAGFDGLDTSVKGGGVISGMDGMWLFDNTAKTGTHGIQSGGKWLMVNMAYRSGNPFTGLPRRGFSACGYSGLPACDGSGPRFYACDAFLPPAPPGAFAILEGGPGQVNFGAYTWSTDY